MFTKALCCTMMIFIVGAWLGIWLQKHRRK